jgi:hypothetical protein
VISPLLDADELRDEVREIETELTRLDEVVPPTIDAARSSSSRMRESRSCR